MATMTELRTLASEHEIEGRSKMDHLELTHALERAGARIPPPVFPDAKLVELQWKQTWRLVRGPKGGTVKEKVDGDWKTVATVDRATAEQMKETLEKVWPHGKMRISASTG